jgi:hypothetical protein
LVFIVGFLFTAFRYEHPRYLSRLQS